MSSYYWRNGIKKKRGRDWLEDLHEQVRECEVCHGPILLADKMLAGYNPQGVSGWNEVSTCCQECRYKTIALKYESKRYHLEEHVMIQKVSDFRESLGFAEADTLSTFDPWDLASIMGVDGWDETEAWDELLTYVYGLKREYLENIITSSYYSRKTGRDKTSGFFFYTMFSKLFHREFFEAPLWNLPVRVKAEMRKVGIEWASLNKTLLFDRMASEIYPNGLTFNDWQLLTREEHYGDLRKQHPWFPTTNLLFYKTDHYESIWEFVKEFRNHINRDEQGRFLPAPFKRVDFLVNQKQKGEYNTYALGWTRQDYKDWFFEYLLGHYEVQVEREGFPFETDDKVLQHIINLRVAEVRKVKGFFPMRASLNHNGEYCERGRRVMSSGSHCIRWLVSEIWPTYELQQTRWNRMLLSEKLMSDMLNDALLYYGYTSEFSEATNIPTEGGKDKARYTHSKRPMKIDFRCDGLRFIVEGQGEYHYMQDEEILERLAGLKETNYVTGLFWNNKIPDSYQGEETSVLGYRQWQDREKRKAIEANGYTPIYVILADIGYPVEGVHGDIPVWNRRFVSETEGYRDRFNDDWEGIGLAETFDMQGREDIGDMIRQYYYEVVLA